jgi:hypothetical protein
MAGSAVDWNGRGSNPCHSRSGQPAKRLAIVSSASGLLSTNRKRRSSGRQAAPVVPLPAQKSRTVSPGREEAATIRFRMPSGFWVG